MAVKEKEKVLGFGASRTAHAWLWMASSTPKIASLWNLTPKLLLPISYCR
jgi:hypothetical protein